VKRKERIRTAPEYDERIKITPEYEEWIAGLRDRRAVALIDIRVKRLAGGNRGRGRFLGKIAEMKIDYGPGYRVYYTDTGSEIIILLCGGDKSTQQSDIKTARKLAARYCKGE
jgi:putative addiction module killer protein